MKSDIAIRVYYDFVYAHSFCMFPALTWRTLQLPGVSRDVRHICHLFPAKDSSLLKTRVTLRGATACIPHSWRDFSI